MSDWNERYKQGEHASDEPDPTVLKFASSLAPGKALDLACGAGRHAIWLAERGWTVTAVDYSIAAIDILQKRAAQKRVAIDARVVDLERHEFFFQSESYDLIVVCNYLQRDLFSFIKDGTRVGGVVAAVIAMIDDDPAIKPMNPAYLLKAGELRDEFKGWQFLWDFEGRSTKARLRNTAEIVAVRLI